MARKETNTTIRRLISSIGTRTLGAKKRRAKRRRS
jgi:hypothetical protein